MNLEGGVAIRSYPGVYLLRAAEVVPVVLLVILLRRICLLCLSVSGSALFFLCSMEVSQVMLMLTADPRHP